MKLVRAATMQIYFLSLESFATSLVLTFLNAMECNTVAYVEYSNPLGVGCVYPRDTGNNDNYICRNDKRYFSKS